MSHSDIIVVGGGLSGLALTESLHDAGRDVALLEARPRLGGRIHAAQNGKAWFDLGPAWFWPGQPRMEALVEKLGLTRFDQFARGELLFETETGAVQRGRGYASMEGSWRVDGGFAALIQALHWRLPKGCCQTGAVVTGLSRTGDQITVHLKDGSQKTARQVVLALPPRIAATLEVTPALPKTTVDAMKTVPTWMAGQAKALAIYDQPFWRESGLSGDAMSRHGPMVEIHDASPATSGPYALFGFIGVPPAARQNRNALKDAVLAQFSRLFGDAAARPLALHVQDWACEPFTATEADAAPLYAHPSYGLPPAMQRLWDGRLILSGSETASQFGGYLEGALEAAERSLAEMQKAAGGVLHAR